MSTVETKVETKEQVFEALFIELLLENVFGEGQLFEPGWINTWRKRYAKAEIDCFDDETPTEAQEAQENTNK